MQLRVIQAADTREAMARMREALGEDAVILATQATADGGVRLTAAVEGAEDDLASLLTLPDASAAQHEIAAALAYHAVPQVARNGVLAALPREAVGDTAVLLAQGLAGWARFRPLSERANRPLMLVGPHGAGKTAAAARLVVDALLAGRELRVLSTDTARAGGLAQLEALLQPLGRAPVGAGDAAALAAKLREAGPDTIVDTSGINPFRGEELARLADLLRAADVEPVLVLPAGLCPEDSLEIAANFAALGVRRLIATRLDSARRLGGLLAAAATGMAFAGGSISPTIGRGSAALTAAGLARLLLRRSGSGRDLN